ncbi:hypothetical protein [Planococcus sp. CAU13]|uniref:hypothetical protein n=1 Tax=Planococcus sp. CAU13 TaxID=1541197 RepID=UPI0005300069|nr:hypothetical protein [Planococcus sp. CAU13]
MKKWGILVAGMLFLSACTDEEAKPAETESKEEAVAVQEEKEMTESGFITQIRNDKVLVNNIYFSLDEEVAVNSTDGSETTEKVLSDIRTGMKVDINYSGPLGQAFPLQAEADSITILNDAESAKQTEALQAYINKEQLAGLLIMGQPIVRDNEIGFLFNNMDSGQMQEVRINLDTHEYTVGDEEKEDAS